MLVLVLAALIASAGGDASPAPASTPKEIIHLRSTPFCTVFRQNVFRSVEGLMDDDGLLGQSSRQLHDIARDSVIDPSSSKHGVAGGQSIQLDRYRLGQTVHQIAQNLVHVYDLLGDAGSFPKAPKNDDDRDLAAMRVRLVAVADAQLKSLNALSGFYETAELNDLLSRSSDIDNDIGMLRDDSKQHMGQSMTVATASPAPAAPSIAKNGSLFDSTDAGTVGATIDRNHAVISSLEDSATNAVLPGVQHCNDAP